MRRCIHIGEGRVITPAEPDGSALCHIDSLLKPCNLLPMKHINGGETHVFKVAGVVEKETTFVLQILHSFSADQHSQFMGASQAHKLVSTHNLAKVLLKLKAPYDAVLCFTASLGWDTVLVVCLLLSSLQFLASHFELSQPLATQA